MEQITKSMLRGKRDQTMVKRGMIKNFRDFIYVAITGVILIGGGMYLSKLFVKSQEGKIKRKGIKTVCGIYHIQEQRKQDKVSFRYCYGGSIYKGYVYHDGAKVGESYSFYFDPDASESDREYYVNWNEQHVTSDSVSYIEGIITDVSTRLNTENNVFVTFTYAIKGIEYIRENCFPDSIKFTTGQKMWVIYGQEFPHLGVLFINQNGYMNRVTWCEVIKEE